MRQKMSTDLQDLQQLTDEALNIEGENVGPVESVAVSVSSAEENEPIVTK